MADFFLPGGGADNFRLFRSRHIVAPVVAGTYGVVRLPRYAFVRNVWVLTETVVTGTTVENTIGFTGNGETADTDFFFESSDLIGRTVEMQSADGGTMPFRGKWFNNASGMITLTAADAWTAGKLIVFAEFSVIH
jgi:hypothetical protein